MILFFIGNHFLGFSCIQHFVFRCCTYYYPLKTLSRKKTCQLKFFFEKSRRQFKCSTCCNMLLQLGTTKFCCVTMFEVVGNTCNNVLHLNLVISIVLFALGCGILGLWVSTLIDLAVLLIFRYERPENCEDTITVPIYLREKRLVDTLYMLQ